MLYVATVISDVLSCSRILFPIGTSGESRSQTLFKELATSSGTYGLVQQLFGALPFILADGLLVRYPCYGFDFLLHFGIDMAELQSME